MAHFTKQEIDEIRQRLATKSVKDSQFPTANVVQLDDFVAIVQEGINKKVSIENLYDDISGFLYDNYMILVNIRVENGSNIMRANSSADLQAEIRIGDTDVTSRIPPSHFSWTRSSGEPELDLMWGRLHEGVGSRIHVDTADVNGSCTFYCVIPMDSLKQLNI